MFVKEEKRRLTLIVCMLLSMSLAIGTGLAGAKTVLEFPTWQAEEPGFSEWWREIIPEFERLNPNVEVNIYPVPIDGFVETMMTRVATGNPPDILQLPSRYVLSFANLGLLEPIDEYLAGTDILEAWTPMQSKTMVWNGENIGVVLLVNGVSLLYNERMFEEAGVTVPTTLDELLEAARRLTKDTDGDGVVDQYGFVTNTVTDTNFIVGVTGFLIGHGTHWTTSEGRLNFQDPKLIEALGYFKQFWDERLMPRGVNGPLANQYFFEGKAAMLLGNAFLMALRDDAAPEVANYVRVAPYPSEFNPGNVSNSLHIAKGLTPEKQGLVWKFIELVLQPKWQNRFVELTKAPSPRMGVVSDEVLANQPEMAIFMEAQKNVVNTVPVGLEGVYNEFQLLAADAVFSILEGTQIERALQSLERELGSIM